MTILIIKKEEPEEWKSFVMIKHCNKIKALFLRLYWKSKGYEVEELEDKWQNTKLKRNKRKGHPTEKN